MCMRPWTSLGTGRKELGKEVELEEVKAALEKVKDWKAPWPDGVTDRVPPQA